MNDIEIKGKAYPEMSAAIKAESASAVIELQRRLLQRERTDLRDLPGVRQVVDSYLAECSDIGSVPTFEGLAVALGYCREGIYRYMKRHPSAETTEYLKTVRTAFFEALKGEALKRNYSEAMAIFLLKNSNEGYADRTEIVNMNEEQPKDALEDVEEIARRYIEDLGEDLEDI